jgi:hypothetical protein
MIMQKGDIFFNTTEHSKAFGELKRTAVHFDCEAYRDWINYRSA